MNRFWLLCSFLYLFSSILRAQPLPIYAKWQSLGSVYYDSDQSGKELSWDELYRAEFGIKNLKHKSVYLDLAMESEQFFDESHIRLKTFLISGELNERWKIVAGSQEHGFAQDFAMDTQPVLMRGYPNYPYQQMRLNSLGICNISDANSSILSLYLGGNVHNQASTLLSWHHNSDALTIGLSQEFRAMDNHWRTPVTISALDLSFASSAIDLRTVAAVSLLPGFDSTEAHHELFTQTEASCHILSNTTLSVGQMLSTRLYAPRQIQRYQLRLSQEIGNKLRISPLSELNLMDGNQFWLQRLLLNYEAVPACDLGVYYDFSRFHRSKGRHTFGIALAFGIDLAGSTTRM